LFLRYSCLFCRLRCTFSDFQVCLSFTRYRHIE
jgi:hypothetical protein